KCSTTGPKASAGTKVSAPTSKIVPTSITTNSGRCVGSVPAPGGVYFFIASDPAIASVGMVNQYLAANITIPSAVLYQGAFAVSAGTAVQWLLPADENGKRPSKNPCAPGLFKLLFISLLPSAPAA